MDVACLNNHSMENNTHCPCCCLEIKSIEGYGLVLKFEKFHWQEGEGLSTCSRFSEKKEYEQIGSMLLILLKKTWRERIQKIIIPVSFHPESKARRARRGMFLAKNQGQESKMNPASSNMMSFFAFSITQKRDWGRGLFIY